MCIRDSPRCARKESQELLHILKEELKPDRDGISKDGQFLLTTRCCFKHCKTAPNLLIDEELVPHVTKEQPVSYTHLDVYKRQPVHFSYTSQMWGISEKSSLGSTP